MIYLFVDSHRIPALVLQLSKSGLPLVLFLERVLLALEPTLIVSLELFEYSDIPAYILIIS